MTQQVVLEDSTILSLLGNQKIAEQIPCFLNKQAVFQAVKGGCGACARKRLKKQQEEMAKIKSCLIALSPEKKELLKTTLNTKQIKVVYTNASGQVSSVIF